MAQKKLNTNLPLLTSDDLIKLAYDLRDIGFNIDTRHFIDVHRAEDILVGLEFQGELKGPERLKTILAPIFCSTPTEQATFYNYFDKWLNKNIRKKDKPIQPPGSVGDRHDSKRSKVSIFARHKCLLICLLPLIVLSVCGYFYFISKEPKNWLQGRVIDQKTNNPIEGVSVNFADRTDFTNKSGSFEFEEFQDQTTGDLTFKHKKFLEKTLSKKSTTTKQNKETFRLWSLIENPLTVVIEVKDKETGELVADANVTFLKKSKKTDRSGKSSFKYRQKDSTTQIKVSHDEKYVNKTQEYELHGYTDSNITIKLEKKLQPGAESLKELIDKVNELKPTITPSAWQKFYKEYYQIIQIGSFILPFLFLFVWLLRRWYRKPLILEREATHETPLVDYLIVEWLAEFLFKNPKLRRTIQQFRQHRESTGFELDTEATINNTIENGGILIPAYRSRFVLPEYLVLIDRASFDDQQAKFVDELINRLTEDGVYVDRYYFKRDPRVCQPQKSSESQVELKELIALHHNHRLLIFSDVDGFIDPLTGKPHTWIDDLLQWSSTGIFIPERTEGIRYLATLLGEYGFHVGPASTSGLARHIEMLQLEAEPARFNWEMDAPYPLLFQDKKDTWLQHAEPDQESIDELIAEIRSYLDEEGTHWLCACAVYPELHWELTLYLATKLKLGNKDSLTWEEQDDLQKKLLELTRLPWFRHGSMPDWLRIRLVSLLNNQQHQKIRKVLKKLLSSIRKDYQMGTQKPGGTIKLPFARKGFVFHFTYLKNKIAALFQKEPEDSLLADYVFTNYMSSGKQSLLTVIIPVKVKHLFFRKGHAIFGLNPVVSFIIAVVISTLTFSSYKWLQPQPDIIDLIPKFDFEEKISMAGIEEPAGVSHKKLDHYLRRFLTYKKNLVITDIDKKSVIKKYIEETRVLEIVKEIVVKQIGVNMEKLTLETSFVTDLHADEMDTAELLMEFEDAFDLNIPDEDAEKFITIGDITEYITGPINTTRLTYSKFIQWLTDTLSQEAGMDTSQFAFYNGTSGDADRGVIDVNDQLYLTNARESRKGKEPIKKTKLTYYPIDPIKFSSYYQHFDSFNGKSRARFVNKKDFLKTFPNETLRISIEELTGNRKYISVSLDSVSAPNSTYRIIVDYLKSRDDSIGETIYISGVGIRLHATIKTTKAGLDLSNLHDLGVAASKNQVSGELKFETIGISGEQIFVPNISALSVESISTAMQALADIKNKIIENNKGIFILPQITGIIGGDPVYNLENLLSADKKSTVETSTEIEQAKSEEPSRFQITGPDIHPEANLRGMNLREAEPKKNETIRDEEYNNQVTLSWDPNRENNIAGYKIYYGTSSGNYSPAIDVGNRTSYTITGLSPDTYYMVVTAYNVAGIESGPSSEVSVKAKKSNVETSTEIEQAKSEEPSKFQITDSDIHPDANLEEANLRGMNLREAKPEKPETIRDEEYNKQVTLSWNPNSEPSIVGYKIYYGTSSGNYSAIIDVGNRTSYTITGLGLGTYYFVVTAYNAAGIESGYSAEVAHKTTKVIFGGEGLQEKSVIEKQSSVKAKESNVKQKIELKVNGETKSAKNDIQKIEENKDLADEAQKPVTTGNTPPVADAGPNLVSCLGVVSLFDGSKSFDADGDNLSFSWDFGDGETGEGETVTHVYKKPGMYAVTLTVNDNTGTMNSAASDSIKVISNAKPTAIIKIRSDSEDPKNEITFDATSSFDPDNQALSYHWDFGDGTVSEEPIVTHRFESDGNYNVILSVQDSSGLDCDTAVTSQVINIPTIEDLKKTSKERVEPSVITNKKFRATPINNLSKALTKSMLKDKGFFDKKLNKSAFGFSNDYELQVDGKVVYDRASNLMWQQSGSEFVLPHKETKAYVNQLNRDRFAGFSDWRLPTLEEAMSLMEPTPENDNLYINPEFGNKQRFIWTSDLYKTSRAWIVHFSAAGCYISKLFIYNDYYVRAVR